MDPGSIVLLLAIVSGQVFKIPLQFGGILLLDIIVFIFSTIGLINLKFKLKQPPLLIKLAGLFILICLISLFSTPLKLERGEYLLSSSYTIRLLFYFLLGWIIYSDGLEKLRKNSLKILTFSGIMLTFIGLIQLLVFPDLGILLSEGWDPHYFRLVSTFLDPNFVGAFFVLTLLLIYSSKSKEGNFSKYVFWMCFLALIATFSRSAYLMFGVSFFTLAYLKRSTKLVLTTFFLCICLILTFTLYSNFVAEPRNIDRAQSAQYRINTWTQGWEIFSRNPYLGVGFNSYRYALGKYHLATDQSIMNRGSSTNDSSLLYVAATTGIIGLITYLMILGSLFIYGYKIYLKKTPEGPILLSVLGGLLIHSLFANSLFYPPILIWIILFVSSIKRR